MPGMFGIVTSVSRDILNDKVSSGVERLIMHPWHRKHVYVGSELWIAIAKRDGPLEGAELWIAPEEDLIVAIDGELYAGPPSQSAEGICEPTFHCASYIGSLYRERGYKWVEVVRGAFSVVIWDRKKYELWLFVDRYGLKPLCYSRIDNDFIFGSNMSCFTSAYSEVDWQLDWGAVADWFTFQHVLGEKTFIENITLLPNAGRLCYQLRTGRIELDRYWTFDKIRPLSKISFKEAIEEACRLFKQAVNEQVAGNNSLGVYLTSGLDSRTIAGYLCHRGLDFVTATYGMSGCRDMVWGGGLARLVKKRHYSFPLDNGSWIRQYASDFLKASDFFVSYFCSHGINTYESMRDRMQVHLSGIGGGSFAGADTTNEKALGVSHDQQWRYLYKSFIGIGKVFCSDDEQASLFQHEVWNILKGRNVSSFRSELNCYANLRTDLIGDAFILNNRYKKKFTYLIAAERNYFENRLPFMDYRFLDFIFAIPTRFRIRRRLQIGMLDHAAPELTCIPWQVGAKLPTHRSWLRWRHQLAMRVNQIVSKEEKHKTPFEPGRNYPKWLREDCYDWIYEELNSSATKDRGIFNHAYLSNLLNQISQMNRLPYREQQNLMYRIGSVHTFELMCRNVLDKAHS